MNPILVVGHKNPDNDSIASVVAYAAFKNALAARIHEQNPEEPLEVYKPVRLGPLPVESEWILETLGFEAPELISSVEPGTRLCLVDHNEVQQAVDGIEEAEIVEVVDHHRIGNFTTSKPIQFISFPWGCSATVITFLYRAFGLEIPKNVAGVLLSAILTDTVLFKSPTVTAMDKQVAQDLAKIAGLDCQEFGMQIFECRGGEDKMDINTLVCADSKEFPVGEGMVLIAQRETVNPAKIMDREEEIRSCMRQLCDDKGYTFVLYLVTDIMEEGSLFIVEGDPSIVERTFEITCQPGGTWMPGVLSRKKQVAAPLLDA